MEDNPWGVDGCESGVDDLLEVVQLVARVGPAVQLEGWELFGDEVSRLACPLLRGVFLTSEVRCRVPEQVLPRLCSQSA